MGYAGGATGSWQGAGVTDPYGFNDKLKKNLNAKQELADQRDKDWKTLTTNPMALGMSDAQKQKMLGEATMQANAAQNAQVSQMNQNALAGQGFQAGTFAEAARDVADKGTDAAAKASVGINQLNEQLINQEKQRIFAEMDQERQRQIENNQFWRGVGIDALSGLLGYATGGALDINGGPLPDSAGDAASAATKQAISTLA